MTTYTISDLGTRVLRDLGLIGAEETASAADILFAEETIRSEIQMMQAKGIAIWNGSDEIIPEEYLTILSKRIGLAIAPSFGLMAPGTEVGPMEATEINLRRVGQTGPTYTTLQAEYF